MARYVYYVAGALVLASTSAAHMIMNAPTPYDYSQLSTSPLGVGIAFPCHGNFDYTDTTNVTAGSTQTVKFTGSAVHGGGSCEFSVNYGDSPSSNPSDWKVIYTIIGGCPAESAGNLVQTGTDAAGRPTGAQCGNSVGTECVRQFDIPLPSDLPNGKFSFGWTWFNKIGNREMYMNCAPMVMSGGSESTAYVDSLPSIFTANVESVFSCTTGEGVLNIPNPGKVGVVFEEPASGSDGTCSKADMPGFDVALSGALGKLGVSDSSEPSSSASVSGSGSGTGTSAGVSTGVNAGASSMTTPASLSTPSSTTSTYVGTGSMSSVGSNFVIKPTTVGTATAATASAVSATPGYSVSSATPPYVANSSANSPGGTFVTKPTTLATVTVPTGSTTDAAPSGTATDGGGSGGTNSGNTSCSTDGELVCLDTGYFGICDHGSIVRMPLAAGTTCSGGKIARRQE